MVQVESPFSYHNGVGDQAEPAWNDSIREAVKEFMTAFEASSSELAKATEKFAADSQHKIDAASEQAAQSAATSSEMAEAARQAAEEARSAAEKLNAALSETSERIRSEVQEAIDRAISEATSVQETGQRIRAEMQQHIDEMVERIEQTTSSSRDMLTAAQTATSDAQEAATSMHDRIASAEASVSAAQTAAQEAREAAELAQQNLSTANAALSAAQEAAEASRQSAALAEEAANAPTLGHDAHNLLERLETDYQLLTRLVQELHTRLTSLSSVTVAAPAPAPQPVVIEPQTSWQEPVTDTAQVEAPSSVWSAGQASATESEAAPSWEQAPAVTEEASTAAVTPAANPYAMVTMLGRIQLAISPVPDFDRLLHLDSSLGKMDNVSGVTLADYAREEVTFRVDLNGPVVAQDFARDLSDRAGVNAEVTSASESSLTLRLG